MTLQEAYTIFCKVMDDAYDKQLDEYVFTVAEHDEALNKIRNFVSDIIDEVKS